tara:strand:- start:94 stop:546 length:453 start_codon:yes stop_codon:yes gene_type:complete
MFFYFHLGKGGKMGIIYLIKPKKEQLKYIYNKTDLEKRIQKNKLRPGNKRVIPKANLENIKFGRFKGSKDSLYNRYKIIFDDIELRTVINFNDNDWEKTIEFEKIIKNSCFGNYKKLINTLEWLDDKNINIDIAEKLILVEYQQYIQKNN